MNVRPQKWDSIYRETSYSIITSDNERKEVLRQKGEIKKKLRAENEKILLTFKMFYGKHFSVAEWEEMLKKFTCPREAKGVVEKLARELENKGISKEKWLELAEKMFL